MTPSEIIAAVSTIISAIGLVFTAIGAIYVAEQLKESRKTAELSLNISRNSFFLELQERNDRYDTVHLRLKELGWPDGRTAPETPEEWLEVARYMGHLESLQLLIEDGLFDVATVDRLYSHRIVNIVANDAIKKKFLGDESIAWQDFDKLLDSLSDQEVFIALMDKKADLECKEILTS